jgi:hypothetical protein
LVGGAWSAEDVPDEIGTRAAPPNLPNLMQNPMVTPVPHYTVPVMVDCLPVEVMTNRTSVQVKCGGPAQLAGQGGPIQLFAVGLEDPAFVSRVMKVAISGQVAGHHVLISSDRSDTSGVRFGCGSGCGVIQSIALAGPAR